MGNKFSCCKGNSSPYKQNDSLNNLTSELKYDETITSLQHISERETGDTDFDPSTNPTAGPLFIQRINYSQSKMIHRKAQANLYEYRPLKKSSSCSTIFIDDSTVSHPNLNIMIKCVSMAIYYHIYNRSSDVVLDIFDEKIYPLEKNVKNGTIVSPDYATIYRFMFKLFNAAQLSSECAIITLVYLERLLTYAEIDIVPCTWRRILLAAILMASKVWDDQAVWNFDYCVILKDIPVVNLNKLEKRFLELLQFNINVPSSVYAKYYFELRDLAHHNNLILPAEPLDDVRAQKLEAISRLCEHNYINIKESLKKWSSFQSIPFHRRSTAIIS